MQIVHFELYLSVKYAWYAELRVPSWLPDKMHDFTQLKKSVFIAYPKGSWNISADKRFQTILILVLVHALLRVCMDSRACVAGVKTKPKLYFESFRYADFNEMLSQASVIFRFTRNFLAKLYLVEASTSYLRAYCEVNQ